MICHGLMAATRPQAAYLTRFYFCMSLGGVLGGIFSGLIAPRIFSWTAEYPLLVVAAALARPGLARPKQKEARLLVMFVALVVIAALPGLHQGFSVIPPYNWIVWGAVVALVACAIAVRNFPLQLAVLFAPVFVVTRPYPPTARNLQTPRRFTFLRDWKPDAKIALGDARLTIADATDARYDAIVVDAFSSDSIPVHLLTREALRIYLSRLNPGGIIITHISNNHLDLRAVVTATAASEKLIARLYDEDEISGADPMIKFSTVMILARNDDDFVLLKDWELQTPAAGQNPCGEDFSHLPGPLVPKC